MRHITMLATAAIAVAACSSATPNSAQPRANAESGIRVDVTATSDDGNVVNPTRALEPAREQLGQCYKETLASRPGIAGSMTFVQTVESDGRPANSTVTPDIRLAGPAFETCVRKALDSVRFAGPIARTATVHGSVQFGAL